MEHQGSAAAAAVALLAAAGGVVASTIDPSPPPLAFAMSPDDLTAWTKAICNNLFTIVNTLVGCYNLLALGHSTAKRRRASRAPKDKPTPPDGPAPHTEPTGGAT